MCIYNLYHRATCTVCAYDVTEKLGTLVWMLTRGNRLPKKGRLSESFSFPFPHFSFFI